MSKRQRQAMAAIYDLHCAIVDGKLSIAKLRDAIRADYSDEGLEAVEISLAMAINALILAKEQAQP